MFGLQNVAWTNNTHVLILLTLYIIGGGLLYWQVVQMNEEADGLRRWKIAVFTLISGPIAWVIMFVAYIMHLSRRLRKNRWYYFKLKILDWLKDR